MSLSTRDWNNWLANAFLEEKTHNAPPHTGGCRPSCHLWRHCCDTGLALDYRRAEGDTGFQMFRRNLFSFFAKSTRESVRGSLSYEHRLQGQTVYVCVCQLSPCLFSWSHPSPLSLLPTINRWSLLPQPKPSPAVVSSACQEVWLAVFGSWCRQKMQKP